MRKLITGESEHLQQTKRSGDWLDLEQLAQVEISSEDAEHPIESALIQNNASGWRANEPGKQTIRLVFDKPQNITRIQLLFEESSHERTQEFVLRWSPDDRNNKREIVRQQYNTLQPGVQNTGRSFSRLSSLRVCQQARALL